MKKIYLLSALTLFSVMQVLAETPWSQRMANSLILSSPNVYGSALGWNYVNGTVMSGFQELYKKTNNSSYLTYIEATAKAQMSGFSTYTKTLDNIKEGTTLLFMYENTSSSVDKASYKTKVDAIRTLLKSGTGISRTSEGGFWHKDPDYASQMWGDGLYMAEPFYAQYSTMFNNSDSTDFADIANQFILFENHARDSKSGLLYHGWSEQPTNSLSLAWANSTTGCSQSFWARANGWYIMGLIDVLDYFPKNHPKYNELLGIVQRLIPAIIAVQDTSGCWYDVLDQAGRCSSVTPTLCNYLESSGSCMFAYSILKAVRMGYIDNSYLSSGKKAYEGILRKFVNVSTVTGGEKIVLTNDCQVAGLGGSKNRSGSFDYYMSEPIVNSDVDGKPIGPFILASLEYESLLTSGTKNNVQADFDLKVSVLDHDKLSVALKLNKTEKIKLILLDINGKTNVKLMDETLQAGMFKDVLSLPRVNRGTYILQIQTDSDIKSQKVFIP